MIKAGIIGAAGYTAGELIRLLNNHPEVKISTIQSESQAGKKVGEVHKDLVGEADLIFQAGMDVNDSEVIFLCKGHGESKKNLEANPDLLKRKLIDLSQDFRLKGPHDFVYGLPELNRDRITKSNRIANPGCFATCIQLGLLPAIKQGVKGNIHVSGITGSTGAGQAPTETTHFSWRSSNASVYKPMNHQHLLEIRESFQAAHSGFNSAIRFIPYRGAFTRGIITTSYFETSQTQQELMESYMSYYDEHPFVHVLEESPDVKMVVNTNKCLVFPEVIDKVAVVVSVIDNLLKGASGQAVQNMNLMFGYEETTGLKLKPAVF